MGGQPSAACAPSVGFICDVGLVFDLIILIVIIFLIHCLSILLQELMFVLTVLPENTAGHFQKHQEMIMVTKVLVATDMYAKEDLLIRNHWYHFPQL